jgi:hypothetical protein
MKKIKKILISFGILTGAANFCNAQSNTASQQNETPVLGNGPGFSQPSDSSVQQSVTIVEPENSSSPQKSTSSYRPTEKIRVYSGSQTGNNLVRTIEVALPEDSPSSSEAYVPH